MLSSAGSLFFLKVCWPVVCLYLKRRNRYLCVCQRTQFRKSYFLFYFHRVAPLIGCRHRLRKDRLTSSECTTFSVLFYFVFKTLNLYSISKQIVFISFDFVNVSFISIHIARLFNTVKPTWGCHLLICQNMYIT